MSILTAFPSRPPPPHHPGSSRSPSDSFSPFSPRSAFSAIWPPAMPPPPRIRTNVRRRDDTRHEDPSKWVDGDLISYVHSTYPAADSAPLQELIRVNRLTPQALWYLQTEHEELTRLVSEASLQQLVLSLAQTIKPAVSPTTPRIRHVRRLSEDLARPPPPPPPSPPPPEEPELLDDNDLAESVLSDWALDDVLEDPEEAPEAHGTHEAASGDATAPAAPAAGENSLGLDTGAEDTMPTAPVPQPQPQPAPSQDTETENLVNLDSEDDAPQTTYGAESQAPPGAFAQAEDSASSDYLSVDLQHDAEEDMTRADGATEELPSQHQEPHVSEPTEEHPSDDINRADPPVPEHEHEDTNANAGAGEGEAQGELVDRADNPNPPGAFRAEPDDDDDLSDPWGKADETTQPGDPEQKSTSVGRTEEHEQEDREQEEREKTVEPEPVSSVPSEETKPPAEFVPGGGEPSGETAMDEQQPTPPAAHVETEQPVNQISPEIPVPAGGENPGEVVTDEQQSFPLASHVETDQRANQTPEQTATRPSQEEPERPTGEADSATSVPTTSQAEVKEHETSAQRDDESEHAVPAPVPAIEASGVEAEGGQSGAAGDTQPSQDSASKTDKSLPSPPDASRETTSTETGASTQDDPAVVVGQQNEQSSGVSEETSSQQAGESTPTPKATETTEPPTQPQGAEEKEQKPEGASTDANVTVEGESRPSASQTLDGSSTDACSKDIRVDTTAPTTAPAPEGSRPSLSANFESAPPTPATEGPSSPVQGGGATGGEEQTGDQTGAAEKEAKRQAKKARQAEKAKAKAEEAERKAKAEAEEAERKAKAEAEEAERKAKEKVAKKAKREAEKQAKRRGQQARNAEQTVDNKDEVQDLTGETKVGVEEGESNEIPPGQSAKPSETTTLGSNVGIDSTAMPDREPQTHSLIVASQETHPTQLTSNEPIHTSSQRHSIAPQELETQTPEHKKTDQSTSSDAVSVPAGTISQPVESTIVPQTNWADAETVHDNEEPTKSSGISFSSSTSSNLVSDNRVTSHTSAPSSTPSHTGRAHPSSSSSTSGPSLPSLRTEQHGTGKASSTRAFTQQHIPSQPTSPAVRSPVWGSRNLNMNLFSSISSSITNVWMSSSSPSGSSPRHSSQERDVPPALMSTSSLSTPYQQRSLPVQQSLSSVVSSPGTLTVRGSAGHPPSPIVGQRDMNPPQPSPSQTGDGNPSATVSEKDISDALSSNCLVSGDGPSDNTPTDAQTEETLTAPFDQQKADNNQGGTADADEYVKVEVEDADDGAGNMGDDDDDEDNQPLSRLNGGRQRRQSTVAARVVVDGDQSDAEDSTIGKPQSGVPSRARVPLHARVHDIARLDEDESSPTTPTTDAFGNESTETGTTSSALLSGSQKRRQRKKKKTP